MCFSYSPLLHLSDDAQTRLGVILLDHVHNALLELVQMYIFSQLVLLAHRLPSCPYSQLSKCHNS
jgi:ABC-type transporter Mla MlaB component